MAVTELFRDLKTVLSGRPHVLEKPTVVQLPINDICNARCQMCNIWQQKRGDELTPDELRKVLESDLFTEVHTVGLNGGEPTLRTDLSEIGDTLFDTLPRLRRIALITNALRTDKVTARIDELATAVRRHGGGLDVMISLDGPGQVHDRVRGRPGNFDAAMEVLEFLRSHSNVDAVTLACTVVRDNVYHVHELLELALNENVYIKFRVGIPHRRLYSLETAEPFALGFEEKYHFATFLGSLARHYETSRRQRHFYESLIGQLMYGKARTAGCDWQHRGVTLSSRGELLYCAVESETLGSTLETDAKTLYFDRQDHLQSIVETKCDGCMHDYVGLPPRSVFLREFVERVLRKSGLSPERVRNFAPLRRYFEARERNRLKRRVKSSGVNPGEAPEPASLDTLDGLETTKVLLMGWYGTETLGDKAILGGVVQALRNSLGSLSIDIASLETFVTEMTVRQMAEFPDARVLGLKEALESIEKQDLVVFAGGPLMALDEMTDMLILFQLAAKHRVPTLVAGCGVGPLNKAESNATIRALLQHASARIYRDERSRELAESLGIDVQGDLVAEDPAFLWIREQGKRQAQSSRSAECRLILGLRDWPAMQYAPSWAPKKATRVQESFEREILKALQDLVKRHPDLRIVPFPMCTNAVGGDDRWFYRRLFRNQSHLMPHLDLSCLGAEMRPEEALKQFQNARAALTMRYHSLVFAISTNTPAVAIDYTLGKGKVKSLATRGKVPHRSLDVVDRAFLVDQLSPLLAGSLPAEHKVCNELHFGECVRKSLGTTHREVQHV